MPYNLDARFIPTRVRDLNGIAGFEILWSGFPVFGIPGTYAGIRSLNLYPAITARRDDLIYDGIAQFFALVHLLTEFVPDDSAAI
jgi:hypothetical protein